MAVTIPEGSYKKAKFTVGFTFVNMDTREKYRGFYIEDSLGKYYSGKEPSKNSVRLEKVELKVPSGLKAGLKAAAIVMAAGLAKKAISKLEKQNGKTKRYFVQDKVTNKISETDKDTFTQAKVDLPNQNFAEVDWILQGPAEDIMFGEYKFEGAASKNRKAIQAIESQITGISKFITDYTYLVEEPVEAQKQELATQTFVQKDPDTQLDESRKARFDKRTDIRFSSASNWIENMEPTVLVGPIPTPPPLPPVDPTNPPTDPVEITMADGRIWDQRNLNVTSYRDGWPIPEVNSGWETLTTGAWCHYEDSIANGAVYGRMYKWYAMMGIWQTESDPPTEEEIANRKNIAPQGWSAATEAEWLTLRTAVGGQSIAGRALKESGNSHWVPTNTGTNSSFFTALPGGYRNRKNFTPGLFSVPTFQLIGTYGYWLMKDAPYPTAIRMQNKTNDLLRSTEAVSSNWLRRGSSIRLIKDSGVIPDFITKYPTATSNSLLGTGGYIPDNGEPAPTERGIVYGVTSNPTILAPNIKIQSGDGFGEYFIDITGLTTLKTYYIRAYVILPSTGISYAEQVIVSTASTIPDVDEGVVTEISTKTASYEGYVRSDGELTLLERGVCWNKTGSPTTSNSKAISTFTGGDGLGSFVVDITGLDAGYTYYARAYARNSSTTGYGDEISFTALSVPSLNLILNQYTAHHAYSLRKLSDTFNYKCLRVRRTTTTPIATTTLANVLFNSDGTVDLNSQIVYVSGYPTEAITLGEFAASVNNGYDNVDEVNENQNIFINIWYDQSGNDKNVLNNSITQQPKVVSLGNLELGARFSGGQILSLADSSAFYNNESIYVVGSATATTTMNFYSQGQADANSRMFIGRKGGLWYNNLTTDIPDFIVSRFVPNVTRLYELVCGASTTSAYSNGLRLSPSTVPSMTVTNATIKIGANSLPVLYSNGLINEVICLVGTPSRTDIESNIMTYYSLIYD